MAGEESSLAVSRQVFVPSNSQDVTNTFIFDTVSFLSILTLMVFIGQLDQLTISIYVLKLFISTYFTPVLPLRTECYIKHSLERLIELDSADLSKHSRGLLPVTCYMDQLIIFFHENN